MEKEEEHWLQDLSELLPAFQSPAGPQSSFPTPYSQQQQQQQFQQQQQYFLQQLAQHKQGDLDNPSSKPSTALQFDTYPDFLLTSPENFKEFLYESPRFKTPAKTPLKFVQQYSFTPLKTLDINQLQRGRSSPRKAEFSTPDFNKQMVLDKPDIINQNSSPTTIEMTSSVTQSGKKAVMHSVGLTREVPGSPTPVLPKMGSFRQEPELVTLRPQRSVQAENVSTKSKSNQVVKKTKQQKFQIIMTNVDAFKTDGKKKKRLQRSQSAVGSSEVKAKKGLKRSVSQSEGFDM